MVKKSVYNKWSIILFVIGLLAVIIPHIGYLAKFVTNLNVISHSVLILIASILIIIGYFLKRF